MPVSINNTTLTFNDGTTMTSRPVTSVTGAGTVSVSASTGAVTITGTGGTGTVTSVATGNGLQGGTITSTGTLSVACPTYNTVGSYAMGFSPGRSNLSFSDSITAGSNYAAGGGYNQILAGSIVDRLQNCSGNVLLSQSSASLSGTWKWMGASSVVAGVGGFISVVCRVS